MKVIIDGKEKGILYKNGKFVSILDTGKYNVFGDSNIELVSVFQAFVPEICTIDAVMARS